MRVRAVVVNYNGGDEVLGCLRALLASDVRDLEVVVVDNCSVDGSPERIEADLPSVRVVRSPGNLGYPAINQVAQDLDAFDALAIVNPDAVVAPSCLSLLASALEEDPRIGAACPRIRLDGAYREIRFGLDGPARSSLDLLAVDGADRWHLTGERVRRRWHGGVAWTVGDGSVLRTTSTGPVTIRLRGQQTGTLTLRSGSEQVQAAVGRAAIAVPVTPGGDAQEIVQNAGSVIGRHGLGMNRGYHRPDGPAFDQPVDVPAWCGAAALVRSDYLRDVGLLDPRWFLYYEDTDLAWRGLLRGWRYRYAPAALVTHAHSTTIGHGSGLYDVQHLRNRLLTVTKNAPAPEVAAAWREALSLVAQQLRGDVVARLRDRRIPEPVLTGRRLQALGRAARMTPDVLRTRRAVRRGASVPDDALPILGRWQDPTGAG
jgi:GT2 family glycosyltransferase